MKWMIASDLHGSAFYCKKMIEAFEREKADCRNSPAAFAGGSFVSRPPQRPARGLCPEGGHPTSERAEAGAFVRAGQLRR